MNSITKLERAKHLLAEAKTVDEVVKIRDLAEAARVYAKQARLGLEAQNYATEIKLRAERKAGQILKDIPKNEGTKGQLVGPGVIGGYRVLPPIDAPTLEDIGVTKMQSSRWQAIASIPEADFEAQITQCQVDEYELTTAQMLRWHKQNHQHINTSSNNEWYTPAQFVDAARQLMGQIDLDPASNTLANQTIQASKYFDLQMNGLAQPWKGKVWLNPPYGKEEGDSNQARWSRKLIEHYQAGDIPEAVLLINAVPGNSWFAPLWDFPICFPKKRIRFNSETEKAAPTHSNALIYLGQQTFRFWKLFSQFGPIASRTKGLNGELVIDSGPRIELFTRSAREGWDGWGNESEEVRWGVSD